MYHRPGHYYILNDHIAPESVSIYEYLYLCLIMPCINDTTHLPPMIRIYARNSSANETG